MEEKPCGQPNGVWCTKAYMNRSYSTTGQDIRSLEDACRKIQKENPEHCKQFKHS